MVFILFKKLKQAYVLNIHLTFLNFLNNIHRASEAQAILMKNILTIYKAASGQAISLFKSKCL